MERFTDRSMKVLSLAKQEAIAKESAAVFTQHILVGMMRESSGVANNCLSNFHLSIKQVRDEIEKWNPPKEKISDKIEWSPHTRDLFNNAIEAAKKLGHNYIGTEHLLMGLLSNNQFTGYIILERCGVKPDEVKHHLLKLLGLAEKKYKLKEAKDVIDLMDVLDKHDNLVAFYSTKHSSLCFVNSINIPLNDMEEIIELCREFSQL